ncbi:MAG: hypothetical protein IPK93_11515 [Solirubrobacterales bacterium]|nr:hypothetical protein [Solirubrobacterales bacterium]
MVLIDPPYRMAPGISRPTSTGTCPGSAPGGRVVVESAAKSPLELPSLEVVRERRYGRTLVTFHEDSRNEK